MIINLNVNKYKDENKNNNYNNCNFYMFNVNSFKEEDVHKDEKIKKLENENYKKDKEIINLISINNNYIEKYIELSNNFEKLKELYNKLLYKRTRINVKESSEYLRIKSELNKLKIENENYYICRFNMLQNTIDSLNNELVHEKKIKNKYKEFYLLNILDKNEKIKYKNEHMSKNKNFNYEKNDILCKYPINLYKDNNKKKINKVICEYNYFVECKHKIMTINNIDEKDIKLDMIIKYIMEQRNISSSKKTKIKYRFERCKFLYETYGNKINYIKFRISNLECINKKDWISWINELNRIIKGLNY